MSTSYTLNLQFTTPSFYGGGTKLIKGWKFVVGNNTIDHNTAYSKGTPVNLNLEVDLEPGRTDYQVKIYAKTSSGDILMKTIALPETPQGPTGNFHIADNWCIYDSECDKPVFKGWDVPRGTVLFLEDYIVNNKNTHYFSFTPIKIKFNLFGTIQIGIKLEIKKTGTNQVTFSKTFDGVWNKLLFSETSPSKIILINTITDTHTVLMRGSANPSRYIFRDNGEFKVL